MVYRNVCRVNCVFHMLERNPGGYTIDSSFAFVAVVPNLLPASEAVETTLVGLIWSTNCI